MNARYFSIMNETNYRNELTNSRLGDRWIMATKLSYKKEGSIERGDDKHLSDIVTSI